MPKRDARNLSPAQLDELRARAIALWQMGWNHRAIAALLEVHYNSVGRWVAAFQTEGPGAIANNRMATVLKAKGYHYQYLYCLNTGHGVGPAKPQILPHALEWLWQGYPISKTP